MEEWKIFIKDPTKRNNLFATVILLVLTIVALSFFLNKIENRMGVELPDPVLSMFHPYNLTWLTNLLIYGGLILGIVYLAKKPALLLFTMQCYITMIFFRIIAMYLLPLAPPANTIELKDPIVQIFGTGGKTLKNDLFFSGHTSTMFLLYLTAQKKWVKDFFLYATVAVAVCLLLQHVHYTIDLFAAPFFAFGSVMLARYIFSETI